MIQLFTYIHLIMFMGIVFINSMNAQEIHSGDTEPFGYTHPSFVEQASFKKIPANDLDSIIQHEDSISQFQLSPYKIGYQNSVNINMTAINNWIKTEKGDSIALLSFYVEEAKAVNILFDKYWLPEGARLYIYNKQQTHFLGPFTSWHNNGTRSHIRGLSSGLLAGNELLLEYHPPENDSSQAIISLKSIVNIYNPFRFLTKKIQETFKIKSVSSKGYGDSDPTCQVNVNCSEGGNWQDEKKSVVLILYGGERHCTGFLVNNTKSDDTPYLMTAEHCLDAGEPGDNMDWLNFYFMYETDGCSNPVSEPGFTELNAGATLLSRLSAYNDGGFALMELNKDPSKVLSNDSIFYAGWNRTNDQPQGGGVMIHHPSSDVKKIATYDNKPEDCSDWRWKVDWISTSNGFSNIEHGSSGSPVFNANSKVIGPLSTWCGFDYGCEDAELESGGPGKIYSSWDGTQKETRLKDWLDPLGINPTALEGRYAGSSKVNPCKFDSDTAKIENTTITENTIFRTRCSYTISNTTIDNNASVIVSHQWETVIENDFEIKSGCSFELYAQ